MHTLATTKVDIYNDESSVKDAYNYEYDDDNTYPAAVGVIMSIVETNATTQDPDVRTPRTVRKYTGRLPSNVGVTVGAGTRLHDTVADKWYRVQSATQIASPVHTNDIQVDLDTVDS
jgi:hypothetical protein